MQIVPTQLVRAAVRAGAGVVASCGAAEESLMTPTHPAPVLAYVIYALSPYIPWVIGLIAVWTGARVWRLVVLTLAERETIRNWRAGI